MRPAGPVMVADQPIRPKRVRVVLADRRPAPMPIPATSEISNQTDVGRLLVRGLIRAQLAAALRIVGIAVLIFGSIPALLAVFPALGRVLVLGIPLPWLVLGVLAFPLLYLLGRVFARQAERNEREFAQMVQR